MYKENKLIALSNLGNEVIEGITGFKLDAYLIALEGWRRGLELKWYRDQSDLCEMNVLPGRTSGRFFSLSDGNKTHYFFASRGDKVSNEAASICRNKSLTKKLLKKAGINVPIGGSFEDEHELLRFATKIGYPVVLKPQSGSMGRGVFVNLQSENELKKAIQQIRRNTEYKELIIEKFYQGDEYRVYVVGNKVIGAIKRVPANVIGDGIHSIRELIEIKNKNRKLNPYLSIKPIKIDSQVRDMLKKKGYTLDSVPEKNEKIFLRNMSNLSQGGDPIEATDELTDEVKELAVNALKALPSMDHGGLDIIVDPDNPNEGTVLEINSKPEISFHLYPLSGNPKDIPSAIIDYYFPDTINKFKSTAFFDYKSILKPLNNRAVEELKISDAPSTNCFKKTFLVQGKVINVGYMSYIKRQALKNKLYGECKRDGKNVKITIIGSESGQIDAFKKYIYDGSHKSVVVKVIEDKLEKITEPFKIGFEITN